MPFMEQFPGGEVLHYDFTWLRCLSPGSGTLSHCDADREEFWFCSELFGPEYDYARTFFDSTGLLREETDRFAEACKLVDMAKSCFAKAQETVAMA